MSTRTRERDSRYSVSGSYEQLIGGTWYTTNGSMRIGNNQVCVDEVNERDQDNSLDSKHYRRMWPVLVGVNPTGTRKFDNFPIQGQYAPLDPSTPFAYPNWANIASEAAALTNPSKPLVNVPAFVGELKDLPGLLKSVPEVLRSSGLKHLARGSLKGAGQQALAGGLSTLANANLAYKFGWRPLLADLSKLIGAADALNKALALLDALSRGKCVKRRYRYALKTAYTNFGEVITHSNGTTVKHRREACYYCNEWVTTRWAPTAATVYPPMFDKAAFGKAAQLVYGVNSFGVLGAIWELIPWSWFVDWFWNIGQWLNATNNFLQLDLQSICWMRTTSSITYYTLTYGPSAGFRLVGDYSQGAVRKERRPVSPLLALLPPLPGLPCLTGGQWSIIGSLLALRAKHM